MPSKRVPTLSRIAEVPTGKIAVMLVVPPDGGFAWCIVAASFMTNFILDGIIFSFGNLLEPMSQSMGITLARTSLISSVQQSIYYMSGPLVCAAVDHFGFRWVAFTGALTATLCLLITSFLNDFLLILLLYGMLAGLGLGAVYSPSVIIVGYYFERYRAIATGIAMCGTSAGIAVLNPLFNQLRQQYGWERTVQVQAGLLAVCMLLSMTFKQIAATRVLIDQTDNAFTYHQQLDDVADNVSETYSEIEFSHIFSMQPASRTGARSAQQDASDFDRVSTISNFMALYQPPPVRQTPSIANRLRACCSKLCPCCCKPPSNNTSERTSRMTRGKSEISARIQGPLNRRDIFFSGSLIHIPEYREHLRRPAAAMALETVHASATTNNRCMCCSGRVAEVLALLVDLSLLRSPTFAVILTMNFFYMLGLLTPYMYLALRSQKQGFSAEQSMWLVTYLSAGNMFGRIMAGMSSFAPRIDVILLVGLSTIAGGLLTAVCAVWFLDIWAMQIAYATSVGFLLSFVPPTRTILYVKYLGLERLTNAFGLSMVVLGVSALIGSPLSSLTYELSGDYRNAFLLSSVCHVLSGCILLFIKPVHRWETNKK